MIDPATYNASIYQSAVPTASANEAAKDAAAAADFERILAQPANTPATTSVTQQAAPVTVQEVAAAEPEHESGFFSFFKGIIDVINPLQHIPVVSAIYRHITGDTMHPMAQLAGDAIYGGPMGAALAVADITYAKTTGKDVGQTVLAALTGGEKEAPVMVAQNLNDNITPAAGSVVSGAVIANDIVWSTPEPGVVVDLANSSLSPTPTPLLPQGTREEAELAQHPTPTPTSPVLVSENNANPTLQQLTASEVDSTTVLHSQTASGDASRTGAPPELIAAKMMEGLDKYKAMNIMAIASANGGTASVNF